MIDVQCGDQSSLINPVREAFTAETNNLVSMSGWHPIRIELTISARDNESIIQWH
ncbi:hypothetical protein SynMVIR181_03036 [Synechococcus sp. MVIR-18-1]|nr:hypothetical protein SynMVIR181_03036 [Synechococcus sp. MVIR-18-1]